MQDTMPDKQIKLYDFLTDLDKLDVLYKEAWMQLCWMPHETQQEEICLLNP